MIPNTGMHIRPTRRNMRPKVYTTPRGVDSRVQRITQNLLARMRAV